MFSDRLISFYTRFYYDGSGCWQSTVMSLKRKDVDLADRVSFIVGVVVLMTVGWCHAIYMKTLHENDLWFSNIKVFLSQNYIFSSLGVWPSNKLMSVLIHWYQCCFSQDSYFSHSLSLPSRLKLLNFCHRYCYFDENHWISVIVIFKKMV